ncbi:MAG TPA: S-methyl-5-thioribose-1-phosphate isomerase [Flexilinea sp.]|jgi:methylthioribose-1-phosphate isomerase|nr:S-methyl-5-thioribose-1-phosphate isomerase [Flexilinea sp.]HOP01625.1 S-methyl-5-thioribose-1-phosphate isomerase [Flexilinea sp.]HOW07730.1 S-methyl-5-thioribose-1-phosphate isomerase [Flexilinea sp.]HPJ65598.1 S-methyl-5-thioribose-1-phosphate isomerase [Flexilinea sp.]HPR70059.1 S-methyl-5-thioribose-1-phosphate isomerase [Flexilinea sp.]
MESSVQKVTHIDNIRLSDDGQSVIIIDQTQLPNRTVYLTLSTAEEMYDAIFQLKIRGAPAIGICAGYCLYCLAKQIQAPNTESFLEELNRKRMYLSSSRPTAVNLSWALNRVYQTAVENRDQPREKIIELMKQEAIKIHEEDIAMCRAISEFGLSLLREGDGILTHCNAGPLATSRYGTALGPIFLGKERGMEFHVFADETRPLLQGARLTSYELYNAGIDVTLICDNMASLVMKNGWVQACLVGCDRVAINGDTANKIGTSGVAILAKYYGIPFYVLGPTSTIDRNCKNGGEIQIELRDPEEIKSKFYREPMAPAGVKCYNPAFDVTDHSLISAIVTEKGICRAPYEESIASLFG